ncbi:MAG: chloride channel protein [Gemmataceae bacterium]
MAGAAALLEVWWLRHLAWLPGAWPALAPPLAMLFTALVTRFVTRADGPATSELYILTYLKPGAWLPARQLPGRWLAAATTVAFGGSQGFESASALIGSAWGSLLTYWRRATMSEDDRRGCLAAGASAGIAAVFSSPGLGALYGIEVPYRRGADAPRLVPCAVAAVCSFVTRDWLVGSRTLESLHGPVEIDGRCLLGCLLVALLCGLGARLFALAEDGLRVLAHHTSRWQRVAASGVALAALAWAGYVACGEWITFGPGYIAADWLAMDRHPLGLLGIALLIRVSGNLMSVYGGGGGGVFTSLALNGVFVGRIVAEALGCPQMHLLALLGAACFLGSGYRLPLGCMLYVAEAGGGPAVAALGIAAVAIGQVLMGDASVSDAQSDGREATTPAA